MNAEDAMRRALRLARRARRRTWPNPMVGAVVVRRGKVVGEGFHRRAGGPHAEVVALDQAGKAARGADLYVTLEPCHLTGRTPPCTDRIRAAGIRRVFVGTRDPNPREAGRGIATLRRAGIEVKEDVLGPACRALNEVYNVFIREGRPHLHLKLASSLDGRIAAAGGDARWISSEESRRHVHRLRARCSAVMVGTGTALKDDPRLDVRHVRGKNPAAVVLDARLELSPEARLLAPGRGAPVYVYTARSASADRAREIEAAGASIVRVPARRGRLDLPAVCADLLGRGVYSLLVEGGATLAGALVEAGLVDKLEIHLAPRLLGANGVPLALFDGPGRVQDAPRLEDITWRRRGPDMCCTGRLVRPGGR